MIFGLEHVLGASMMVLASAYGCPQGPPPHVQIFTKNGTPRYFYHVPSATLGLAQIDTTFTPIDRDSVYVVGGLTQGNVTISRQLQMQTATRRGSDQNCVSATQVNVTLDYQPDVYIASEYKPGTCRYQTTMEHEVQHVNLDIITLNEFIPRIQSYIQQALISMRPIPPVPQQMVPQVQEMIGKRVEQAAQQALAEMDKVRKARHQRIDNALEYNRLSRACAHEPNPIPMPGGR